MSSVALARELASTLMLLQDTYAAVRRKEAEIEALELAHAEEIKSKQNEIDALNARLLLNQLMQYVRPPDAPAEAPSDEYSV